MASHNRTPASVLEAPTLTPVLEPSPVTGMWTVEGKFLNVNRADRRITERGERFRRPIVQVSPRPRPERIQREDTATLRAQRRADALAWRMHQKMTRDNEKAARTLLREGVTW